MTGVELLPLDQLPIRIYDLAYPFVSSLDDPSTVPFTRHVGTFLGGSAALALSPSAVPPALYIRAFLAGSVHLVLAPSAMLLAL